MKTSGTPVKNSLLVFASVAGVLLCSVIFDRALGSVMRPPGLPSAVELIFPPFAEQHFKTVDFEYTARINSIGIRDRELPRERDDAFRILAIGDSYTYGWGVDIEESWPRLLEDALRADGFQVEILNLGKPGVGPPFYAELAERAIPLLRPDMVIIGVLQGNDLRDAGPEEEMASAGDILNCVQSIYPNMAQLMRDMRRKRMAGEERTHKDMPPQITTAEDNRRWTANTARAFIDEMKPEKRERFDRLEEKVRNAFLEGVLNPYMVELALQDPDAYTKAIDPDDPWTQVCIERTAARFMRIRRVAEQYGCEAVVVCIPEGPYVNKPALSNMTRVGYNMPEWLLTTNGMDESIRLACKRAAIPFYEVTHLFREHQDDPDLYFELDGHPTPKGNHLFVEAFLPVITSLLETTK
mgnify:CR=1 FL=1